MNSASIKIIQLIEKRTFFWLQGSKISKWRINGHFSAEQYNQECPQNLQMEWFRSHVGDSPETKLLTCLVQVSLTQNKDSISRQARGPTFREPSKGLKSNICPSEEWKVIKCSAGRRRSICGPTDMGEKGEILSVLCFHTPVIFDTVLTMSHPIK